MANVMNRAKRSVIFSFNGPQSRLCLFYYIHIPFSDCRSKRIMYR